MTTSDRAIRPVKAIPTGRVTILVGIQWGDEGKGKWIDMLAQDAHITARFQGGNNAGHTLYLDPPSHKETGGASRIKVVLHQIPSGIFQGRIAVLGPGVVVNPGALVEEITQVRGHVQLTPNLLWISHKCHVITPWNIFRDSNREASGTTPIGTTQRGIGPTYEDRASRLGIRMHQFVDPDFRRRYMDQAPADIRAHMDAHREAWSRFWSAADDLVSFVTNADGRVRSALRQGQHILAEGAQGTLLDVDHGTYPFVTSSSTVAANALVSLGLPPHSVDTIYGVAKAYTTRVGAGPFPTELSDRYGEHMSRVGAEFGATTGRRRRCGWLDMVALRYACAVNGISRMILNKIDVLSDLDEVRICTAYDTPQGRVSDYPTDPHTACTPVYETLAGWSGSETRGKSLGPSVRKFVDRVAELAELPVEFVGVGVGRTDYFKIL